jgi:CHAT domain-containing protein
LLTYLTALASLDPDDQSSAATAIRVEALGRLIDAGAIDWAWRIFTQLERAVPETERMRWKISLAHYRLLSRTADKSQAIALADNLVEQGQQTQDPWVRLQVQGLRIVTATTGSEILDLKRELQAMRAAGIVTDDAETGEMLTLAARLIEEIDRDTPSPETSVDAKNLRDLLRWWSHPGALPLRLDGGDVHSVEGALHAYMGARPDRRTQRSVGSSSDQNPSPEAARALAASWQGATEAVIIASRLAAAMRLGDALTYIEEVESRAVAEGHTRVAAISAVLRGYVLGALGDRAGAIAGLWDGASEFQRIGEIQLAGHALLHIGRFAALDPDGDDLIADRVKISEGGTLSRGERTLTTLFTAKCAFEVLGDEIGLAEVRLGEIVARWTAGDGWFVKRQLGELSERCWRLGPEAVALAMEATVLHAQLLARAGETKDLRKLLRRLRRRQEAREPFWSWQIDTVEARACLSANDTDKATTLAWQALDAVDRLRWHVGDELQRSMWIVPRREVWEVALEAAFARGDATAGLMVVERGKSSSLARLLLATASGAKAPMAPAVGRALLSRSPLTGPALTRERQEQARSAKAEAIATIRRSNAQLASAIDPPSFELSMLEALAQQMGSFAFVDFLELGKGRWWVAWGTDQGPVNQHKIELNPHDQNAINRLNSIGTEAHDVARWIMRSGEQAMRGLGAVLLPALTEVADSMSTLLISSSGALMAVPFAALDLAPGLRVFDRFATLHIPSLTTVGTFPHTLPGRCAPIILACDPQGNLPSLRRQVHDLTQIWPGALVLEAAEASLEALRQLSDDGRLAHARSLVIAAHGAPHPDDPVASGVLLGDGEVLNAGMLLGLRLPSLVEFWTCGSGAERPLAGDEHLGLVTSALMAGARQVLATKWSLADRYVPFLSATFHSSLRRGMPAHQALREAQRMAASSTRPFVSWAPLVIHGIP